MGRNKIPQEKKRKILSLHIPDELFEKFEELEVKNKSKFFTWLLVQYFNAIEEGGINVTI